MKNISDRNKRRLLLVLDLISMTAAYFLSMGIRFSFHLLPWQLQLYSIVLFIVLLVYLFMYTYRQVRGNFYYIQEMDPLENLARLVRDRFFLYASLVIVLALTRSMGQISRRFLLLMVVLDTGIAYGLRMVYRHVLLNSEEDCYAKERYLLVTTLQNVKLGIARLRDGLSNGAGAYPPGGISGIAIVPEREGSSNDTAYGSGKDPLPGSVQGVRVLGYAGQVLKAEQPQPEKGSGVGSSVPNGIRAASHDGSAHERFNHVFVYLPEADAETIGAIVQDADIAGYTTDVCLTLCGNILPVKMIQRGSGSQSSSAGAEFCHYAVAEYTNMKTRCRVLGVNFAVTNVEAAACFILNHLAALKGQYVCFSNVHTTVMAREDPAYCAVQNGAAYTFADGAPIAGAERSRGYSDAERCAGPDFMDAVFRATMDGSVGHYFYGSSQETVGLLKEKLEKKYPGIRICGVWSPPFRKLEETSEEEDLADIRRINESGASIVWIGLGAPKQEKWMAAHRGKLEGTMFGVGAGFNFYAENVKRAPRWIQKLGLEWLYRLFQDPKRLFNRYFVTNLKFVWYMLSDPFRKK